MKEFILGRNSKIWSDIVVMLDPRNYFDIDIGSFVKMAWPIATAWFVYDPLSWNLTFGFVALV